MVISLISLAYVEEDGLLLCVALLGAIILIGIASAALGSNPSQHPNSLITGKITGNFAESGHPRPFSCPISARIQCLTAEFPTQRNREFSNAYQGIFPG
jgi:hypothetical protein